VTRYADHLLADGERVVLRARQHWLAPLVDGRAWVAVFVASIVLIALSFNLQAGGVRDVIGWVALALLVVSLARLTYLFWGWYSQDYLVTNRRVLKVEGIVRKRSADSSLEKINDAVLTQGVVGRMLGFGDLEIMTAAEESFDRYAMLAGAQQFKRTMLDEKHELEEELVRAPGPPLRAAMPTPPAPDPAAPAAVAKGLSADDITKALGALADLRDRGAISPEEYDAKKQDLLGRL
jgi:Bacterial PH domain/Short C-terminal domain